MAQTDGHGLPVWTGKLKRINGSAVASDGGSLFLELEWLDGQVEFLFLNRSIASRGTPAFNTVTSDKRSLSNEDITVIIEELEQQKVAGPEVDLEMVATFADNLKRTYGAVNPQKP